MYRLLRMNDRIMALFVSAIMLFLCMSCGDDMQSNHAEYLNDKSYHYHYISLDSTVFYADSALQSSSNSQVRAEALNNLAFASIMRMDYADAREKLSMVQNGTGNQIELMVANVQMMRLCQRVSENKEFYDYYWAAKRNFDRIEEDKHLLTDRQRRRVVYAETEMRIVLSTYLYYVGQLAGSVSALASIDESGEIQKDTAQLLNYFYNIGTGDYFDGSSKQEINQKEFSYLVRCYFLASRGGRKFWQANALQAISEHLQDTTMTDVLILDNMPFVKAIDAEDIPDSLMAGNLAQRSLEIFAEYGDVYQTAGALRTLSDCYFLIGEHENAIECLNASLQDSLVYQAPALISSIYERLSVNYAAINDKTNSDHNRNLYLDTQENTRQDMELDARAEQLDKVSVQLNVIMAVVLVVILFLIVVLAVLARKRRKNEQRFNADAFLIPLDTWRERETKAIDEAEEQYEEVVERRQIAQLMLDRNMRKNIEQRVKMSLINSITPFIDRMVAEIKYLQTRQETEEVCKERYAYILELADRINDYNDVLTDWIQLRQGELSLKIESFALQELFDIVEKGRTSFNMQGVELSVAPTEAVVKADKALTLFMINTMADNARKAVKDGGQVSVSACQTKEYVEIAVEDNGMGMDEEQLQTVFNHRPTDVVQHGFGLMNCKGIIEKYKKVSQMFSVCRLTAESKKGEGSVFRFRLPNGLARMIMVLMCMAWSVTASANNMLNDSCKMYADSAYFCNLQGRYEKTLEYASRARAYLNIYYKEVCPEGIDTLVLADASERTPAELVWLNDSLDVNYNIILDLRNETAVAALALHQWDVYNYNNDIYIQLFRELSADRNLAGYVRQMKRASDTKNVAIIVLVILLMGLGPAYYIFYYRYKIAFRALVDRINKVNGILLENSEEEIKLETICNLWNKDSEDKHVFTKDMQALDNVVEKIVTALESGIKVRRRNNEEIETEEEELRRVNYENDRLHVNNNVLDNCFSALKHETMYYPLRIRQIIESPAIDVDALSEITNYYKLLYTILSMQAQTQVETSVRADKKLMGYLESLLQKLSSTGCSKKEKLEENGEYASLGYSYPDLIYSEEELAKLFTPLTPNLNCLLIRQIIREIGESTNLRGCGVTAKRSENSGTDVIITLPKGLIDKM